MRTPDWIPEVVIVRLPIYLRALTHFEAQKIEVASSQELGDRLHLTAAQIRKDLSYFGRFGKQGRGYNVKRLLLELRRILGLEQEWPMALVGVGRLGRAIMGYAGFAPQGFRIVAAFDIDPSQMGKKVGNLVVQDMGQLPHIIRQHGIQIGIVAVPPSHAQAAIDTLVKSGVRSILNYAPLSARVPDGVKIRDIDPVLSLQSMTYYLKG
ncbi:MAG: redox-sensing transcriptional repressor Rex [Dehalococcoidia bacterium]